jgi:PAS domain S-box-containing protein
MEKDKKAEKPEIDYKLIAESTYDCEIIRDIDGKIIYLNPSFERIFGYKAADYISGKIKPADIFLKEDKKILEDYFNKIRNKETISDFVIRGNNSKNKLLWISISAQPILDKSGKKIGMHSSLRDISDRRIAEESLKESEKRFKSIYEGVNDAIFIHDDKGNIIEVNEVSCSMLAYSKTELMKMNLKDIDTPEYQKMIPERMKNLLKKGYNHFESVHRKKDGKLIQVDISAKIIDYLGKKVILSIIRDMTERKASEEFSKESEKRFKDLFNNVAEGVVIYETKDNGNNFIIKDFNKSAEKIENLKKENVLGKNVLEVFPGVTDFGLFDVFKRVYKTGKAEYFPIKQYNDKRITGWRENYIFKIESGELVAVYSDVSEKKINEEKVKETKEFLDSIIENIPHMIFVKDAKEFRFEILNKTGEKLFGHKKGEILGKNDYDFFPKEQAEFFIKKDREVIDKKLLLDIPEEKIDTPQGTRILHTKKIPLLDENKNVTHLLGISEDITEKRKTEQEIIAKSQELEKFNQFAIGRELKMTELKKEVNELLKKLDEKPKYDV